MTASTRPHAGDLSASDETAKKPAPSKAPPVADLLDHEYDGIREYDNPLPGWWVAIFWGSFLFAIGYWFHFHISHNGASRYEEYEADVKVAREAEAKRSLGEQVSEAALQKLAADPASVGEGKAVFDLRCTPCHGAQAQGLIGPNLTDNSWIHGKGTPMDIYEVVNGGVLEKGMPAWGKQLTPTELRRVVAFVTTLHNTNVPGKAPEGTKVD